MWRHIYADHWEQRVSFFFIGSEESITSEANNRRGLQSAIETAYVLSIYAGMLFYFFFIGSEERSIWSRSAMSVSLQVPHMHSICGCGGPDA